MHQDNVGNTIQVWLTLTLKLLINARSVLNENSCTILITTTGNLNRKNFKVYTIVTLLKWSLQRKNWLLASRKFF